MLENALRIDHQWIIIDGGKIDGSCGDGIIDTDTDEECDDGQATHYCTETCTLADNFISTWLIEEGDLSLTLPLRPGYNYDFHVDWGDGSPPAHVNSHFDSDRMHTYASPNTYTVTIQGRLEAWYFNNGGDKDKLLTVPNLGNTNWRSLAHAFHGCQNLTILRGGITDRVTSMRSMFESAHQAEPDGSTWDTSAITDMGSMFKDARAAKPNTYAWNMDRVILADSMFEGAESAVPETDHWSLKNATNLAAMFKDATLANPQTQNWNTSNVTNMESMFQGAATANPRVSGWDVSQVTSFASMFKNATAARPEVSYWDTGSSMNFSEMFQGANTANPNVMQWDLASATTLRSMFEGASSATPNTTHWDVATVTDLSGLFKNASAANPDVSSWNTGNVTTTEAMFYGATNAQPNLNTWDVASLQNMTDMFVGVTLNTQLYSEFLIHLEENNQQSGVDFHAGDSLYNSLAEDARNTLIAEHGWVINDGGLTTSVCGDGYTDLAIGETCDDGNLITETCAYNTSCEVCDLNCQRIAGEGSSCGDGEITAEDGETCDDGNQEDETCPYGERSCIVCNQECKLSAGNVSFCGDGIVNGDEFCDDPSSDEFCDAQCRPANAFISVWRTTLNNEEITFPIKPGFDYNFQINWGDGSTGQVTDFNDPDKTHIYTVPGDYEITISGLLPAISFQNEPERVKIYTVPNLGDTGWQDLSLAFSGCTNLTTFHGGELGGVTTIEGIFKDAINVVPDVSDWDTSSITSMAGAFQNARAANPAVSDWDTASVTTAAEMFNGASIAVPDVSGWDTSSLANASAMFEDAPFANPDMSLWNVEALENAAFMLKSATSAEPNFEKLVPCQLNRCRRHALRH